MAKPNNMYDRAAGGLVFTASHVSEEFGRTAQTGLMFLFFSSLSVTSVLLLGLNHYCYLLHCVPLPLPCLHTTAIPSAPPDCSSLFSFFFFGSCAVKSALPNFSRLFTRKNHSWKRGRKIGFDCNLFPPRLKTKAECKWGLSNFDTGQKKKKHSY